MHKIIVILVVMVSVVIAQSPQIYYVSVSGDNNQNCSIDNPCSSIDQVISVFMSNESNSTSLEIRMFNGTYTGQGNTNLDISDIDITIQPQSSPVIIECENENEDFIFQTNSNLNIFDISMQNCYAGVYGATIDSFISLNSVNFENIERCTFASGGGMIDSCSFTKATQNAMYLQNGNWNVSNSICSNVEQCIYFTTNGYPSTLDIQNITILNSSNGIKVAEALNTQIIGGSFSNITKNALNIAGDSIHISNVYLDSIYGILSVSIILDSNDIYVSNLSIINSGNMILTGAGVVENSYLSNIGTEGVYIYGYYFYFSNVVVEDCEYGFSVYVPAITIENSSFNRNSKNAIMLPIPSAATINNCIFDSNTGYMGAGIYGNYATLTVENSIFNNNEASNNGGAIYINGLNEVNTFINNVTFTNNVALNGAAISCGIQTVPITTTNGSSIILNGNQNTFYNGNSNDIDCKIQYGSISTYYISNGKTSSNCTYEYPCGSFSEAIDIIGDTDDFITLKVFPGNYSPNGNTLIEFPFSTAIQIMGVDEVIIDGEGAEYIFKSEKGLIINGGSGGLIFSNSSSGIIVTSDNLAITQTTFTNIDTGIDFFGEGLSVTYGEFDSLNTAIQVTNASDISIILSHFTNCVDNSINIDSPNNEINTITLSSSTFQNTAGIYCATSNNNNFDIGVNMDNITTNPAIDLFNGNWNTSPTVITNCEDAIHVSGQGGLDFYSSQISNCNNGIYFNSTFKLYSDYSSSISNVTTAIEAYQASYISLTSLDITNVITPLNIDIPGRMVLSSLTIEESEGSILSVASSTSTNSIGNVIVSNNYGGFKITNGVWEITAEFENITMVEDGGAVSFYTNSDSEIYFTSSSFTNIQTIGNGGAIYSNGPYLSFSQTTFTNCSANNGGAIYSLGGFATLSFSTFENCNSNNGGAIYMNNTADVSISNCQFMNNTVAYYGGGIYFESSSSENAIIDSVNFTSNYAINGAAISCCGNSSSCGYTISQNNYINLEDNYNSANSSKDISCEYYTPPPPPPTNENGNEDDGFSLEQILLISFVSLVGMIIIAAIISAVGYFLYRRKRLSEYDVIEEIEE